MRKEYWKFIPGYEGYYESSTFGRVRGVDRYVMNNGGRWFVPGRILKQHKNGKGYMIVPLTKDGKHKNILVHRLVAMTFLPNPDNLPHINHKDENPLNNNVENLEWCDHKYNMNYGTINQRKSDSKSIPVAQMDLDGNIIKIWKNAQVAELEAGHDNGHIIACCNGKRKTHHKFRWKYVDKNKADCN